MSEIPLDWFSDETSQTIYKSLEKGDVSALVPENKEESGIFQQVIQETTAVIEKLNIDNLKKVVIYGAGQRGKIFFDAVFLNRPEVEVIFCDRNAKNIELFCYCEVISPEELSAYKNVPVIVTTEGYQKEISQVLQTNQVKEAYFLWLDFPTPHQICDVTLPDFDHEKDFVWLGNLPNYGRSYNIYFSQSPFTESPSTSKLFQFMPHLYSAMFPPLEKPHYSSGVLPPSYVGNILTEASSTIDMMHLDKTVTLYALFLLKVSLKQGILDFFQQAKETIAPFHPKVSIVFSMDSHTLEEVASVLSFLKTISDDYQFTLSFGEQNKLHCYGVSVKIEEENA